MSFFEEKKAAAILKHAILDSYIDPFVGKTGKHSTDHRVAFIDAYAGEGRYESGAEASPSMLMRKAQALSALPRKLECYFVEDNPEVFAKLEAVVEREGSGLPVRPQLFPGKAGQHLTHLLNLVDGIPLLLFLDPYGLMVPFELAVTAFTSRTRGYGAPATELLINFNATGLRRIAGHLTSPKGSEATLRAMDEVFGGSEWRQIWLEHAADRNASDEDRAAAEEAVVNEYAGRFAKAARCGVWTADVRNRAHHRPVYHLVFLTRHPDGMSAFAEALSLGLEKWRKALHLIDNADTLFGDEDAFKASEETLAAEWVDEIAANLRAQMEGGQAFTIIDRYNEVFGSATGLARQTHLRKAWKRLHAAGVTRTDSKGDLIKKRIEPA
ncbi:hypothetical protein PSN13_03218 [Micromonospora saelicesensis]|uniref:Three-Cys-motif partner protein n=1 Tax=Micromonospora saelicesensis TaxID=285676 RepID=A0A328NRW5_9ACTN|nr:three-Cys-motif partner protein TcmP [Micromonospora saelicesensis]RAO34351.1 hypothetical protein PSN13_03218 [Micromonospora saelicesensis]